MIEFMKESDRNAVGFKASGHLSRDDYENLLIPKLEELFGKYGKLNVLVHMDEGFEGWDMTAAWEDASYGMKHRADFKRLAVVGAPAWVNWGIQLSGFLLKGEVRIFSGEQIDDAWKWIKAT